MIKAGIIGSTGYAGQELVRILTQHKDAEVVWYGSRSYIDQKYYEVFRNMFQIVDDKCLDDNMDELASKVDVIFTATPQGLCSSLVSEEILSKVKIIDLSADFRIKDVKRYEEWYGIKHQSPDFIDEAVDTIRSMAHPLALYIFTQDKCAAENVIEKIGFGGGCINDTLIHLATSEMPFGGFGESGMGSYHGKTGFDTFTHYKSIVDKKTWIDLPMRYRPYQKWKKQLLHIFLK